MSTKTDQQTKIDAMLAEITAPASWEEVDKHLAELRHLETQLASANAIYDEKLIQLQEAKAHTVRSLHAERQHREDLVKGFMQAQRPTLPPRQRKVALQHGDVGWRKGAVKVQFASSETYTLAVLKAQGRLDCIKTTEKVDKTALKGLPEEARAQAGVVLEQTERLYIKLKDEEVVQPPQTRGAA